MEPTPILKQLEQETLVNFNCDDFPILSGGMPLAASTQEYLGVILQLEAWLFCRGSGACAKHVLSFASGSPYMEVKETVAMLHQSACDNRIYIVSHDPYMEMRETVAQAVLSVDAFLYHILHALLLDY